MSTNLPAKKNAWSILRENALQIIMYILGAALMGLAWWPLAVIYLALAVATNIFYMYWVCPYCGHYALGTCAAGFDLLSGRRFKAQMNRTFRGQFRLGTVVVGLGWFLPPLAALVLLLVRFSWGILALLAVFCAVAFWLLPEVSKKHCDGCETVDCPRRPQKPQARG
jgi:hypothetical protein